MYKLKNQGEYLGVAGIAQPISGTITEDLYKLVIKADPKLKDKFEKVEEHHEVEEPKTRKSKKEDPSAPHSDNA